MQKYTKIQASVQHGLYLFTCEIHSFNSIYCIWNSLKSIFYYTFYILLYYITWGGAKNRRILLAIQFLNFWFFFVILAVCFPKLAFGTSKIEILRSKSVWGQIFMQIRPKFNDFLAIYEFVMIFSRMARCLVFVDPIFCPPPYIGRSV